MAPEKLVESAPDAVALPIAYVELRDLKLKSGGPVIVGCEAVDALFLMARTKVLPGQIAAPAADAPPRTNEELAADVALISDLAPDCIETSTWFRDESGREIRPAFFFGADPGTGALPGRYLSTRDRLRLLETSMSLGGLLEGAANETSFPDGKRDGGGDGAGAVAPGEGGGANAEGSASGS